MKKNPRCFKYYADDRICDICHVEKLCLLESKFKRELERQKDRCEHKEWRTGGWESYESCNRGDDRVICRPDETCFPKLFRKFKLKRIKLTE